MQQPRFTECRVCGEQKTNEEMLVHELECLQASQDDLKTINDSNDQANEDQVGRLRNQQPRLEDDANIVNDYNNQGNVSRVSQAKDHQLEDDVIFDEDNHNPESLEPNTVRLQGPRFSDCSSCGVRKTNEAMLRHELDCLQSSQDDNDNPANLEPDRPSRHETTRLPDKISDPPDEDEDQVSIVDVSASSSSSRIPTPEISEVDEYEDLESGSSISDRYSSSSPMEQNSDSSEDEDDDSEKQSTPDIPSSTKKKTKKKNSLVTQTFRYDRKKPKNLFPPTKKYRYYPVTCDFCQERFQPNELKAHQKKYHYKEPVNVKFRKRAQSTATRKGFDSEESPATGSKSAGGMMGRFQFCYICGQMYGSKSINIHEPQCLKKWRIKNNKLPPRQRAQEPVKPKTPVSSGETVGGEAEYKVPEYDPAVEAAFDRHLASLIPCKHCSRKFSPDRIQKHTSCCIDRPKSRMRECATPKGGEIPR